jgi:hypothetical protein
MHDENTVQRLIELRVQGRVFTRIAAELNVTKPPSSPGTISTSTPSPTSPPSSGRTGYGRHAVGGSITQNLTGKNKVCFGQETVKFCGGSHPGCQLIPNSDVEVRSGATARGARAKNRCQKWPNRAKKRHEITPDTPKPFEPMSAIPPASSFQVLTAASQNSDSGHLRSSLVTFGNLRTPYRLGGVPITDFKERTGSMYLTQIAALFHAINTGNLQ